MVELTIPLWPEIGHATHYIPPSVVQEMARYGMATLIRVVPSERCRGVRRRRRSR